MAAPSKPGNTYGRVSGPGGNGKTAKAANPIVKNETPAEIAEEQTDAKNFLEKFKDKIDQWTDNKVEASGYSQPAMVAGAVFKAGVEMVMPTQVWDFIPGMKQVKTAKKGVDAVKTLKKGERAAAEAAQTTKKAETKTAKEKYKESKKTESQGGKDTKIKQIRSKKVKCFCVDDHAKGGRDEYKRQLDNQQKGINDKTVDEYLADRAAFDGKDPCSGAPTNKTSKRNPARAKDAKNRWQKQSADAYEEQMRDKLGRSDAKRLGAAKAQRDRNNQNALHNSDMKAGGKDQFGSNGDLSSADFGDAGTNKHIGSQWNGERIDSIDKEACQAKQDGKGSEKMNVELKPCGAHEAKAAGCKQKKRKAKK
jgi:hypothetical protein